VVTCACSSAALGDLICHAARLVFRFSLRDEFGGFLGLFLFWFWALMVAAKKKGFLSNSVRFVMRGEFVEVSGYFGQNILSLPRRRSP